MCGVMGLYPQTENSILLLPFLAYDMERRGDDSWGCTDGSTIIKEEGAITKSFKIIADAKNVIYHTRRATTGAPMAENAHPFVFEGSGGKIIGIHNGIVSNYTALNSKYNRDFDVDSMHLFKHLADGLDMEDISAWGVMIWYDGAGVLRFCKISPSADFEVMRLGTGEIVFCSEKLPIEKAVRITRQNIKGKWDKFDSQKVYKFGMEGAKPVIIEDGKLQFESTYKSTHTCYTAHNAPNYRYPSTVYSNSNSNVVNNNNGWQRDLCRECQEMKIFPGKELLCRACFNQAKLIIQSRRAQVSNVPMPSSYISVGVA